MTCLLRIILPTRKFLISPTLPCLWSKVGKVGIYIHTDNIRTIVVERKTDRWKITSLSSSGLSIYLFIYLFVRFVITWMETFSNAKEITVRERMIGKIE